MAGCPRFALKPDSKSFAQGASLEWRPEFKDDSTVRPEFLLEMHERFQIGSGFLRAVVPSLKGAAMRRSLWASALGVGMLVGAWGALLPAEDAATPPKPAATPAVVKRPSPNLIERIPAELPEKVIDRLKVPVNAKFTLPLEHAFQSLFATVDVKCVVDGIALKSVGITKNEPQRLNLENKPLHEAIQAILQRKDRTQTYPEVAFCIDEEKKTVTVTTRESAKAQKLETIDFGQFQKKD